MIVRSCIDKYLIFSDLDPANTENSTDYSSSGANTTGNGNKKKSSKNSPEDSSSSLSSTGMY